MKQRKNRFGDITVHDKAYLGGILYGKNSRKTPESLMAMPARRPALGVLLAPFVFVVDGIGHIFAMLNSYWLRATKRVPSAPPVKSVYTMSRAETGERARSRKIGAALCFAVLVLAGLTAIFWPSFGPFEARPALQASQWQFAAPAQTEESPAPQSASAADTAPDAELQPVVIHNGDEIHFVFIDSGTVSEALDTAMLHYDHNDDVTPPLDESVSGGDHIVLNSLEVQYITEIRRIPYKTVTRDDATLEKGKTTVKTQGREGQINVTVRIEYRDGEEISREEVSETVIAKAVDKVVLKGTKNPVIPASASAYGLRNDTRAKKSPPTPEEIAKTVSVEATAYTHTGNRTATGTRPKVGTVAVNPKQIPYGTKLYIEGYGYGVAEDTGAFRFADKFQIDLFMDTERECVNWGRKRGVTVYILK